MTDQPGWAAPEGEPRPRPPVSSGWAAEQPPPASYGAPSYGGGPGGAPSYGGPGAGQAYDGPGQPPVAPPAAPGTQGWGAPPPPGWGAQPAWSPPKPGVIPLRPLGAMEILDGAVSTVR
ncbi:MAG: hypothetical protein ACXV3V_01220, partial [Actinomycetes bacterium]